VTFCFFHQAVGQELCTAKKSVSVSLKNVILFAAIKPGNAACQNRKKTFLKLNCYSLFPLLREQEDAKVDINKMATQ
jgi:hypothetical protein